MSDHPGLQAPLSLKIEGPNPASELAIYDSSFNLVESGIGSIETVLPSGLYDLEASIANQRERKSVALRRPMTVNAGEWEIKVLTAAPLSDVLPAHTLHEQKAQLHSRVPTMTATKHAGNCRLFIFLRTVKRDPTGKLLEPVQRFWTGFKLHAENGDLVSEFADDTVASELEKGWCALTVDLAGGGYVLSGPRGGDKEICVPVWLHPHVETHMFVPVEDGRPLFDGMALAMAPKGAGFDTAKQGQTEFAAAMLAGFRRGNNPVNPDLIRRLLDKKLYDPFVGIIAAHGLLRMEPPDEGLLREIIIQLRQLLGDHPDVVALELMITPPVSGRVLKFPPNVRLGLDGVLRRSALNSQIIDLNPMLSDVLGGLLTGQYVLWQRDVSANAPIVKILKGVFWNVVTFAPGLLKLFKTDEKQMVKVDLDALVTVFEDWLKEQDPEKLAAQLGLPGSLVGRTIKSLLDLLPAVHGVARGSLRNIELPPAYGNISNMALEGVTFLVKTASAAIKLPAIDRRVIELIVQYWETSGGRVENVREATICQRRLLLLANTAAKARDLLPLGAAERHDVLIVTSILSGLAARFYPFLLVGREFEVLVAAGSFTEATGERSKLLGHASATIFGSALEIALRKNPEGQSGSVEDFAPIAVREAGIAMDFVRVQEKYWVAGLHTANSKFAVNQANASPPQDLLDRHFIDLAKKIEQDCASFIELVRDTIDPFTPTRQRLEELPGFASALSKQLQQRISDDVVTAPVIVT